MREGGRREEKRGGGGEGRREGEAERVRKEGREWEENK